ncbi:MAG: glucose-6-phosphate isomerase [Gemmatimonadaceae bacterium]|nr:glucose-6-phosphate isomerase [Gloeobacterales cyanobacterium ES-bin-141]
MLTLSYYNAIAADGGFGGLSIAALEALQTRSKQIHHNLAAQRQQGNLYFADVIDQTDAELDAIEQLANEIRTGFENLAVLGIGGSSLGAIALHQALNGPYYNERVLQGKTPGPRLFFLDNVDPDTIATFTQTADLDKTAFNAISKSGGTTETVAQMLWVSDQLADPAHFHKQMYLTTDPTTGSFRKLINERGFKSLPVPTALGGRYSVLSAVGLLPAAAVGIDIRALLGGAKTMRERCTSENLLENPAYLVGALHYLADRTQGRSIAVMMPYLDRLFGFAQWFGQLWAESLGKRFALDAEEILTGQTPVSARGTTDQHSQLQLYAEGPQDKLMAFLALKEHKRDLTISADAMGIETYGFLQNATFGQLLNAEQQATEFALRQGGRISYTITLDTLDAATLGGLMYLYELATVFAGGLYRIDPLDQPGVELSKVLTFGLMGRGGYETQGEAIRAYLTDKKAAGYHVEA